MDCPEDVASYIHRVGRTARYQSEGRSLLFVMPSETKMLEKLDAAKIPIESIKVNCLFFLFWKRKWVYVCWWERDSIPLLLGTFFCSHHAEFVVMLLSQANNKRLQSVSGLLSSLLVKYPDTLPGLAKRAFITYLKSIQNHKDKEVFDVMQLPVDEFSASMGLPMTPKIRFSNHKMKSKKPLELSPIVEPDSSDMENALETPKEELDIGDLEEEEVEKGLLRINDTTNEALEEGKLIADIM